MVSMDNLQKSHLRLLHPEEAAHRMRFEETFLHHLDPLYRTALRLSKNKADAEDLLQETLLKALKKFHQILDPSKTRAWLFRILVTTFYNIEKKRKRQLPIVDVELNEDLVTSSFDVPVYNTHEVFGRLLGDEIEHALEQLHPEFKIVILLYDVEGLDYNEIAEICQCSKGTVASRLYRAREILRTLLEAYARKHGYL